MTNLPNTITNSWFSMHVTRMASVEIEVNDMDFMTAAQALQRYGSEPELRNCAIEGHYRTNHNPHVWQACTDCTVDSETKTNPSKRLAPLYEGMKIMSQEGATVSGTNTGAHINIDASDYSLVEWKRLAKIWTVYEPLVIGLTPRSRRDSEYAPTNMGMRCEVARANTWQEKWDIIDACQSVNELERKFAPGRGNLNMAHHNELRSTRVEWRFHQGTLNPTKLSQVIKLLCIMMDSARWLDLGVNAQVIEASNAPFNAMLITLSQNAPEASDWEATPDTIANPNDATNRTSSRRRRRSNPSDTDRGTIW